MKKNILARLKKIFEELSPFFSN